MSKSAREKMTEHLQRIKHMDQRVVNESLDRHNQMLQLELLELIAATLDSLEKKFDSVLRDK